MDVSIIVPAFNEEAELGRTLAKLTENFPEAEVIVVDDGSTDGTAQAAVVERVRLIRHSVNKGYGAAIKTGVRAAGGRIICWYDADGQHSPADLKKLLDDFSTGEYDAVIGARSAGSYSDSSRAAGKTVLSIIVQMVAGRRIPDINCGMRVFSADVLRRYLHLLPEGFSASITTTLLMIKRGYRVRFTPVISPKRIGESSVRQLRDGFRAVHVALRILLLFQAFMVFSISSAVFIFAGAAYSLYKAFTVHMGLPVAGAVMILTGVIIFFMGLLCDQIVALRMERLESGGMSPERLRK